MIWEGELAREFWERGRSDSCPVIDMHGHMGPFSGIWFPRDSAEAMIRSMDSAGVRLLAFSPHGSLSSPEVGNSPAIEAARAHPGRLRAMLVVNPHAPDEIIRMLDGWEDVKDVCAGFKCHPSWHQVAIHDDAYEPVFEFAEKRGLPVTTHTWGGDELCDVAAVRKVAERHGELRLLLAHCFHDRWREAVRLVHDFENLYLDLTAVLDDRGALEMFVDAGLGERLLFGTDLPWFDPHHGIGAVLSAEISDDDRRNILYRNAERLLEGAGVVL